MEEMTDIQKKLFSMRDEKYREFNSRLIPTVPSDRIIGVRIPKLRAFARSIGEAPEFTAALPHEFYEENNLHAFLIGRITDFDRCIFEVNRFLPYVDNWATCDSLRPEVFSKKPARLLEEIDKWLDSAHTYTVRFGIEMLMVHFLDEHFDAELPEKVARIQSSEYYVTMMRAWYFATALAKRYDELVPYLTSYRLDRDTHNKTIQKALESFRISDERKAFLKGLKI